MNTFLNIQQELGGIPRNEAIPKIILTLGLHKKINLRGQREQYNSVLLTRYMDNAEKRKCKGTRINSGIVESKYRINKK
jgi:hypothetical protein